MTNKEIVACLTAHPELIPEVMKILTTSKQEKNNRIVNKHGGKKNHD